MGMDEGKEGEAVDDSKIADAQKMFEECIS
jgi:hypothetical protein